MDTPLPITLVNRAIVSVITIGINITADIEILALSVVAAIDSAYIIITTIFMCLAASRDYDVLARILDTQVFGTDITIVTLRIVQATPGQCRVWNEFAPAVNTYILGARAVVIAVFIESATIGNRCIWLIKALAIDTHIFGTKIEVVTIRV